MSELTQYYELHHFGSVEGVCGGDGGAAVVLSTVWDDSGCQDQRPVGAQCAVLLTPIAGPEDSGVESRHHCTAQLGRLSL